MEVSPSFPRLCYSLDTLDPFKFEIMTRRMGHEAVLRSLEVALTLPLKSVKVNVVVIKGLNDREVLDFVDITKEKALNILAKAGKKGRGKAEGTGKIEGILITKETRKTGHISGAGAHRMDRLLVIR